MNTNSAANLPAVIIPTEDYSEPGPGDFTKEPDRNHNGGPEKYATEREVLDATRAIMREGIDVADSLDGTMLSRLAVCAADYSILATTGGVTIKASKGRGNVDIANDYEAIWSKVRTMFNEAAKETGADLSASMRATIPLAIRAGLLVAKGHAQVERFSKKARLGDQTLANGPTERVCVPFNMLQPRLISQTKIGHKITDVVMANDRTYLTPISGELIKVLFEHKLYGAELKVNEKTGIIALKRSAAQPDAAAKVNAEMLKNVDHDTWEKDKARLAPIVVSHIGVAASHIGDKAGDGDIAKVSRALFLLVKHLTPKRIAANPDLLEALFDVKCELDVFLNTEGEILDDKGEVYKA